MKEKQKVKAELVAKAYEKMKNEILTERENKVITHYYGLDNNVRHSLRELGEMYGVTRERIRQIKTTALTKLKVKK